MGVRDLLINDLADSSLIVRSHLLLGHSDRADALDRSFIGGPCAGKDLEQG